MFSKLKNLALTFSDSLSQKVNESQRNIVKTLVDKSDTNKNHMKESSDAISDETDTVSLLLSEMRVENNTSEYSISITSDKSEEIFKRNFSSDGTISSESNLYNLTSSFSVDKVVSYFEDHKNKFADAFSPSSLMEKIAKFAKKTGIQFIYKALLLYYGLKSEEIPSSNKLIAIAGLGYFITPFDFLSDILPGGFVDDGLVLSFALDQVYSSLSRETKDNAKILLRDFFGNFEDDEII